MFSVVILTLNEERQLSDCILSAAGSDDIVVIDSGSTDRTADIARQAGARVVTNPFADFAQQRNFAHSGVRFRHQWLFHLDADERLTPELVAELAAVSGNPGDTNDGYLVAPRMIYRGRWIPRCTDFPAYQARFVRPDRFRFVQVGHGQREAPGTRLGKLAHAYLHHLSSDGEEALVEKHRRYARHEAAAFLERGGAAPVAWRSLFARDALVRRRTLKALSQRLPARGLLRFAYQYGLRGGFLEGRAGFAYCLLMARYEHWIGREIRRARRGHE